MNILSPQRSLLTQVALAELLAGLTAYYRCRTLDGFEVEIQDHSDGHTYTVTFTNYRFACTCKESRKSFRTCPHIKQVECERCRWDQAIHGGLPAMMDCDSDQYCPRCGEPAIVTLWAV